MKVTEKQAALLSVLDVSKNTEIDDMAILLGWPSTSIKKVANALEKKGMIEVLYIKVAEKFGCEMKSIKKLAE